jgi:hypothetical protein
MRPVETILGIEGGELKENDRGGEFNYKIFQELLQMPQCTPHYNNNKIIKKTDLISRYWRIL